MNDILDYLQLGGLAVILLSVFVEIIPVKINPIQWLGNVFNKNLRDDIKRTESKLDEHIAQSYRNKIMDFQHKCLNESKFTLEEWQEVLQACEMYKKYVHENKLVNGKADMAIAYIRRRYNACLDSRDFINAFDFGKEKRNEAQ